MTNHNKWTLNEMNSEISFSIRHLLINELQGTFKIFDANIYTTDKDFTTAIISIWIDVASLSTGDVIQDKHLTSPDFFDIQNHKQISFQSSSIEKYALEDTYEMWGVLTIKGITKKIKLFVQTVNSTTDHAGNEKAVFKITGIINKSNWGLICKKPTDNNNWKISNDIDLYCEIELTNTVMKKESMEFTPLTDFTGIF